MKAPFLYTFGIIPQVWIIFLIFANLIREKCTLVVAFICISLVSNELEPLHIHSLVIYFFLPVWMGSIFNGFSNEKVVTKNCQAVSELQIKARQPQPGSNTFLWYLCCSQKLHAYLGKFCVYFKPARERKSINSIGTLIFLPLYHL